MSRLDPSNEPNRQTPYRRLYNKIYKFTDELVRHDNSIGYLLNEIRALQKRVAQLEQHHADTASWKLKAAYEGVHELEQQDDLREGKAGGQTAGHRLDIDGG